MFTPAHIRNGALRFPFVDVVLLARVPLRWRLRREIADLIGVVRQYRPALLHRLVVSGVLFRAMLFALDPFLAFGAALVTLRHVISLPLRAARMRFGAENQMQYPRRARRPQEAETFGPPAMSPFAYRHCVPSCNAAF